MATLAPTSRAEARAQSIDSPLRVKGWLSSEALAASRGRNISLDNPFHRTHHFVVPPLPQAGEGCFNLHFATNGKCTNPCGTAEAVPVLASSRRSSLLYAAKMTEIRRWPLPLTPRMLE